MSECVNLLQKDYFLTLSSWWSAKTLQSNLLSIVIENVLQAASNQPQ